MTPTALRSPGSPPNAHRPNKARDTGSNIALGLRRFRPRLALGHQQELHALIASIATTAPDQAEKRIRDALNEAQQRHRDLASLGLDDQDLLPTLQWIASLRVLHDLSRQGWRFALDDEGALLRAPGAMPTGATDPEREKEALRRSFAFAREEQLHEPATESFIRSLERRGVHRLFADGSELADRLRAGGTEAIQPELEFIDDPRARDAGTGLRLQEIWRYARLYWSIPYQSTPGRNMFFLVRDAAHTDRPIIGIAALGNPVLGLAQRDDYAGWSADALLQRLDGFSKSKRREVVNRLYSVLNDGIEETYSADLWPDGPSSDWHTEVERLSRIELESADQRLQQLSTGDNPRDPEYQRIRAAHTAVTKGQADQVDWLAIARTHLYRRKRAGTLAALLRARETLREFGLPGKPEAVFATLETEDGRRAVEIALRRIKQEVIASSVMEIITCGAVPPYRDALGGKLVALLMLSRAVADEYATKYNGQVSLIASALAAKPVARPTRLALLTTSSLYSIGSSQYNRLNVTIENAGSIGYKRVGLTDSFGTVHFSPDTVAALNQIARLIDQDRRRINNLFGEGTSPKLRLIRSGLEGLGLDANVFLRHHSPRLLYGAALCSNIEDVLLALDDEPKYVLPAGHDSTALLVEHWRTRWLARRLERGEILERIANCRREEFLLSRELSVRADFNGRRAPSNPQHSNNGPRAVGESATFVERLYRSTNSYADRLSQEELDAIHVDLGVDGYLLEEAGNRREIVVTGNPGDGKTHLIERLRPQLEATNAEVITDANAISDEETLATWERCRNEGRPFVLAINEWPLFVLQRTAAVRRFTPVAEALRQVREARFFIDQQIPEPPKDNVITIDLSLRNLLAPSVVQRVIERLTDKRFYEGRAESDPILFNRYALQQPQVQERLTNMLGVVAHRLGHVTMRQLVGFIAYILSAGQSAEDRLVAGQDATGIPYSNLAFEGGEGNLFETVRRVFDPAATTHPNWDAHIWSGPLESAHWLGQPPAPILSFPESERERAFRATKRRFFFEHAQGSDLLALESTDEAEFQRILEEGGTGRTTLVRDLVLALNRFYEPDFSEKDQDRLLLWQSHRYDVRAPSAFVSLRELGYQQLRIEPLRYAEWVERWLPPEQQARRSFALVANDPTGNEIAILELDRQLYLTLLEAQRGLGRASWSRTATRRITRFIDLIDRDLATPVDVEDLRVRNFDTDLDERFVVQRQPARYQI